MQIAVVGGTAGLGRALALRLAHAGADVVVGSREEAKATSVAKELSDKLDRPVEGKANQDAVRGVDVTLVAVPFPGLAPTYAVIKEGLSPGAVVIDCNVPLASEVGGKATRLLGVWEGSAAQAGKAILGKDFHMAAGFHSVMAGKLEALDTPLQMDILVCGDAEGKAVAEQVVSLIDGARFVDCGPLERARILESITALLIGINSRYKLQPGAGIRITGL